MTHELPNRLSDEYLGPQVALHAFDRLGQESTLDHTDMPQEAVPTLKWNSGRFTATDGEVWGMKAARSAAEAGRVVLEFPDQSS